MATYVEQLEKRVEAIQSEDNVVAIRLLRSGPMSSQESLAKGVLDLMDAPVVTDNDIF